MRRRTDRRGRAVPFLSAALCASFLLAAGLSSCAGLPRAGLAPAPQRELPPFDAAALTSLTAATERFSLAAEGRPVGEAEPGLEDPSAGVDEALGRPDLAQDQRIALLSLSGELLLDKGKAKEATDLLSRLAAEPGYGSAAKRADPAALLRARLIGDPAKRAAFLEAEGAKAGADPRLLAEAACLAFDGGDYRGALALFDRALPPMTDALRQVYLPMQAACGEKAALSPGPSALPPPGAAAPLVRLSAEAQASYGSFAQALFSSRPSLFSAALSSARPLPSPDRLVADLAASGLVQTGGAPLPPAEEILTRREAATILFGLYEAMAAKPIPPDRYSKRYAAPGGGGQGRSPVPDLSYGSPGFDACLALVELEILDLPDGRDFFPDRGISGMDAAKALKALGF